MHVSQSNTIFIYYSMDKQYEKDLESFCDHGDIGDDWCGEEVVQAILTWIKSNIEFDDSILDIGCGNAALIFQMASRNNFIQKISQLYRFNYTNFAQTSIT